MTDAVTEREAVCALLRQPGNTPMTTEILDGYALLIELGAHLEPEPEQDRRFAELMREVKAIRRPLLSRALFALAAIPHRLAVAIRTVAVRLDRPLLRALESERRRATAISNRESSDPNTKTQE